ncbi:hypothetical protein, partial [Staphylococcus aureus]|uniref:hypothetical protein n=1 Tax=Staphylococcus aureus TaxID=1280 RepID=UPI0038B3B260
MGAVQPTVVKAYDYYNVDEACTVFYSPDSNSALLRTICEGNVCQCAEGGCPPKEPFGNVAEIQKARNLVLLEACEEHDYVWKGRVESVQKKDGFIRIVFRIN